MKPNNNIIIFPPAYRARLMARDRRLRLEKVTAIESRDARLKELMKKYYRDPKTTYKDDQ